MLGRDGALFVMTLSYIIELIEDSVEIFKKEQVVEKRDSNCVVFIGDIHGDLTAWKAVKKALSEINGLYVFLGDYVDRGDNSLEILTEILELKRSDPYRYVLLRGNHETKEINAYYGFLSELQRKFLSNYEMIYEKFNEMFSQMPIAITINNSKILCLHGGIPIQAKSINELRKISRGQILIKDPLLLQVLWNDPDDSIQDYSPSPRGPGIYLFGWRIFSIFMRNSGSEYLIRGHTFLPAGFHYFFNGKLLSIFSPLNYVGQKVKGKLGVYCDDKLNLINLEKFI